MEIKKADSKGRVTGFEPGELYAIDRDSGHYSKVVLNAPDGRPIEDALREEITALDEQLRRGMTEAEVDAYIDSRILFVRNPEKNGMVN